MATTTVKTAIASKVSSYSRKDVTMTMIYAGNKASGSPITASLDLTSNYNARLVQKNKSPDTTATIAAGTATGPTFKPYSDGTFSYQATQKYVIFGYSGTNTMSGASNTKIAFPSSDVQRNPIAKMEKYRTLKQSSWNWITGKASTNTVEQDWAGVVSTDSTDHAARSSRSAPGEFTWIETGKTPSNKDYPARTG